MKDSIHSMIRLAKIEARYYEIISQSDLSNNWISMANKYNYLLHSNNHHDLQQSFIDLNVEFWRMNQSQRNKNDIILSQAIEDIGREYHS